MLSFVPNSFFENVMGITIDSIELLNAVSRNATQSWRLYCIVAADLLHDRQQDHQHGCFLHYHTYWQLTARVMSLSLQEQENQRKQQQGSEEGNLAIFYTDVVWWISGSYFSNSDARITSTACSVWLFIRRCLRVTFGRWYHRKA